MGVSLNWLKNYIDINWSADELAHNLTMAGIAIEGSQETETDTVLELDLTPNRGDCLGMINLAREVAALNGKELKIPDVTLRENQEEINRYIRVQIEATELCRRYSARLVKNCQIKPSPAWMQEALISSGIRPINNVVDVTNYVMLETNQPLHAFDYNLLGPEKLIVVRTAREGEQITTLDGVERTLDEDMLLITDAGVPVALAGVMGGLDTEINDQTTDVLLESACFSGTCIRKTARRLALRSESSMRFEKGTDINGTIYAASRAAQLLQDLAGGEVVQGVCDAYPAEVAPLHVVLRRDRVNQVLGTGISMKEIASYLDSLKFEYQVKDNEFVVEVPTYRPDIELEEDLIEEVARLYGYDRIPDSLPAANNQGGLNTYQKYRRKINRVMAQYLYEVINYSFISPALYDQLLLPQDSILRDVVKVANPLSEEQSVMRTLLVPGLLQNISTNLARRASTLALFEAGSTYQPNEAKLPAEILKLGAAVCGSGEVHWQHKKVELDFYFLKGILENLFREIGVPACRFVTGEQPFLHPGRSASIICGDREIGWIGEVHPLVLQNFDIKDRTCVFEIDLDALFLLSSEKMSVKEITRYPAVERDMALLLQEEIQADRVLRVIESQASEILDRVILFDIYSGEQVPDGRKSLAIRVIFQSTERTLTEAEVNVEVDRILNALQHELQATLR